MGRARVGELYIFTDADSRLPETEGVHILHLPEHYGELSPILHIISLQLLLYHTALVICWKVRTSSKLSRSVRLTRLPVWKRLLSITDG